MNKKYMLVLLALLMFVLILVTNKVLVLRKAHSTFANYYAFRGCTQLIKKTNDYGLCKTAAGATIKIVKFDNRWFLDGDLPCGFLCF